MNYDLPVPEMPPLPEGFVMPTPNIPPLQIEFPPMVFTTPNICDIPDKITIDPMQIPEQITLLGHQIPDKIELKWPPVQDAAYLDDQAAPRQELPKTPKNLFTVESEMFDMMPHVRGIKYKYKPKQVFLVLYDYQEPGEQSPVFKYLHDMSNAHISDTITLTTLSSEGKPLYEHRFLGCELLDHECPMECGERAILKHRLVFRYFSVEFKNF